MAREFASGRRRSAGRELGAAVVPRVATVLASAVAFPSEELAQWPFAAVPLAGPSFFTPAPDFCRDRRRSRRAHSTVAFGIRCQVGRARCVRTSAPSPGFLTPPKNDRPDVGAIHCAPARPVALSRVNVAAFAAVGHLTLAAGETETGEAETKKREGGGFGNGSPGLQEAAYLATGEKVGMDV